MESNTLHTADTFILRKITECNEVYTPSDIVLWTKEYAVLFARWHRKEMIEAIDRNVVDLYGFSMDAIENAYPETLIK